MEQFASWDGPAARMIARCKTLTTVPLSFQCFGRAQVGGAGNIDLER